MLYNYHRIPGRSWEDPIQVHLVRFIDIKKSIQEGFFNMIINHFNCVVIQKHLLLCMSNPKVETTF